jgi:hypothetical protein
MTPAEFRKIALSLPDAEQHEHMDHPDFRVGGRIFATLGYPGEEWAMVKLFPDQQAAYVAADPRTFAPAKGAWGKKGCTNVRLAPAKNTMVKEALHAAWRNAAVRVALRSVEHAKPALKRTAEGEPGNTRREARKHSRVTKAT